MGILHPGEIVYIATDETDKSFFEPLKQQYNVKFLDEFSDAAGLKNLDPNYAGELYSDIDCYIFMFMVLTLSYSRND